MIHASPSTLHPVPLTAVAFTDTFWAPRIKLIHEHTIPYQYMQCKQTGRIDALRLQWQPGDEPVPHIFWESDIAKWIEAASYSLATTPDPELDALVDQVIDLLAGAQQPDGYLNVYFTVVEPGKRWTDLRDAHELYCAGHLIEAGVAHAAATGKHTLLDIVRRYADYIATVFGTAPGQIPGYCGHEEIELALVKLYHATDDERYLRLSKYFVDQRGQQPFYFDQEAAQRGTPGFFGSHFPTRDTEQEAFRQYNQSHQPVREQTEVVGHAVRAMYLYSAMADLARETGDTTLQHACDRLWQHLTSKRMYVTGGIGSSAHNEGFTRDYDLPNQTAYAETCAAVGLVFWAQRMVQIDCDRRYTDVAERALFNGVLSGMSLDGTKFFYENPLASAGDAHRQEWFGCACCPPNLARLLASLGQYMYAHNDTQIAVHGYAASTVKLNMGDRSVGLRQTTNYPWDGNIALELELDQPATCSVLLRLPAWCAAPALSVNGDPIDLAPITTKGYARIERPWHSGDRIELSLPMAIERVYADPRVAEDRGCVALQRGPLVYCVEATDHQAALDAIALPTSAPLSATMHDDLLDGVVTIDGSAVVPDVDEWGDELYQLRQPSQRSIPLRTIPYYAWDNREPGAMRVWLREA